MPTSPMGRACLWLEVGPSASVASKTICRAARKARRSGFSRNEFCEIRLSVRTFGFQPKKAGSRISLKFWSVARGLISACISVSEAGAINFLIVATTALRAKRHHRSNFFHISVAQLAERRSPKPQAEGSVLLGMPFFASIAQLVERRVEGAGVPGSIPG